MKPSMVLFNSLLLISIFSGCKTFPIKTADPNITTNRSEQKFENNNLIQMENYARCLSLKYDLSSLDTSSTQISNCDPVETELLAVKNTQLIANNPEKYERSLHKQIKKNAATFFTDENIGYNISSLSEAGYTLSIGSFDDCEISPSENISNLSAPKNVLKSMIEDTVKFQAEFHQYMSDDHDSMNFVPKNIILCSQRKNNSPLLEWNDSGFIINLKLAYKNGNFDSINYRNLIALWNKGTHLKNSNIKNHLYYEDTWIYINPIGDFRLKLRKNLMSLRSKLLEYATNQETKIKNSSNIEKESIKDIAKIFINKNDNNHISYIISDKNRILHFYNAYKIEIINHSFNDLLGMSLKDDEINCNSSSLEEQIIYSAKETISSLLDQLPFEICKPIFNKTEKILGMAKSGKKNWEDIIKNIKPIFVEIANTNRTSESAAVSALEKTLMFYEVNF